MIKYTTNYFHSKSFLVLCFFFISFFINAQEIFEFKELKPNGKVSAHAISPNISIDISSVVYINFKKDIIRNELAALSDSQLIQALIDKANTIHSLADKGLTVLPSLTDNLTTDQLSEDQLNELINQQKPLSSIAVEIAAIGLNDKEFQTLLETAIFSSATAKEEYENVFKASEHYAQKLYDDLDAILEEEGVYLKLAATLYGKKGQQTPIHFDGFDEFETPDFFDPYQIAITEEQKKELENLKKVSEKINEEGLGKALLEVARKLKQQAIDQLTQDGNECLTEVNDKITLLKAKEVVRFKPLFDNIAAFKIQVATAQKSINGIKAKLYASDAEDPSLLLIELQTDITNLLISITQLTNQAQLILGQIAASVPSMKVALQNDFNDLKTALQSCVTGKLKAYEAKLSLYKSELTGYRSISDLNKLVVDFSDKVLEVAFKDLPESTVMDIKNRAGFRQEGDNIVLEMRAGNKSGKTKKIGSQYFTLLKTMPHIQVNVGLIFTNESGGEDSGEFIASPSTSTIFKFGTDGKSDFYRKFLDFGLGFNVSTLNFDTDRDLEVGLAFVGTAFKDYLQAGYGYNFTTGSWYGLIGFRIPFLTKDLEINSGSNAPANID